MPRSMETIDEEIEDVPREERPAQDALKKFEEPDISEPDEMSFEKIEKEERDIAEKIKSEQDLSWELIVKLSEIEQKRAGLFINKELAKKLELEIGYLPHELERMLRALIVTNNPEQNLILHKVLDFIHRVAVTVQDPPLEQEIAEEEKYKNGFFVSFCLAIEKEISKAQNYLVKKHLQDILETWQQATSEKPDALHGVAGGTSDEMIYVFKNVETSYRERLEQGVNDGWPIANPLLPIAPGFLGFYKNGTLERVYERTSCQPASEIEKQYIARNHPDDNYIYDEINGFDQSKLGPKFRHPSNKLKIFEIIWDFDRQLKGRGRTFYYDMSRIETSKLHPMVVGDLYTRNQKYRKAQGETEDKATALTKEAFLKKVYPHSEINESRIYQYTNLTKLHMRKKIEDDFGINLADYSLANQRGFLEFLETRNVANVEKLQKFVNTFGSNGLKTFLSLEFGKELGDDIIMLGEKLPEDEAKLLFAKYAEIVEGLSELEKLIPPERKNEQLINEAEENLLRRARKIIEDFAKAQKEAAKKGLSLSAEEITKQLSEISKDNQLVLSAFKALQNQNPWLTFENFKDVEFGEELISDLDASELERMTEIYRKNYEKFPRFQKRLLENFEKIISKPDQSIQIIRFKGKIVGFYLYTSREDNSLDFRCFNMDPTFAGGGFGKAMMNQELQNRAFDNVVHATCTAEMPISSEYIESGFVGIGYGTTDEINYLDIVRCDRRDFFPTKEPWPRNEIENLLKDRQEYKDERYLIVARERVEDLPFQLAGKNESNNILVLTRYLRPEKGSKRYILVFEKKSPDILRDYQNPNVPERGYVIL